jgi:hypothetical protein
MMNDNNTPEIERGEPLPTDCPIAADSANAVLIQLAISTIHRRNSPL